MNIRPVNKFLIAKPIELPPGKILLSQKPEKDRFQVITACQNDFDIKTGDVVFYDRFEAKERVVDGQTVYFIHLDRILGVSDGESIDS